MSALTLTMLTILGCSFGLSVGGPGADDASLGSENWSDDDDGALTGDDALCPEDEVLFEASVWEPALGRQCVVCHAAGGPAGSTRLVLDPDDMLANLRAATAVGELLLTKPTGLDPYGHGGGALVFEDSATYDALAFWVDWGGGVCEQPAPKTCDDAPGERRLWRLTHDQYDRTVSALLGFASSYGQGFATDEVVDHFDNDAGALGVPPLLADQYRAAAEALATEADIDALLPCDAAMDDAICAATFIEDFGLRAFRRPLSADDIQRYLGIWDAVADEDGFDEGARWVIIAMLQSPHFLYRSELGEHRTSGEYVLTDWEIASELSYLIWGGPPDERLLTAANAGELTSPAQVRGQVERMLRDDRALATAASFVESWLMLDRLETVSREGLTAELRAAMGDETRALVAEVAEQDGALSELMRSRYTYVDDGLAEHYGLEGSGGAASGWVSLDGERYGGLLTQGSVLTTHALADGSSPIHRGALIRERLLCEPLPPPPPNLDTSPPEVDPTLSTRERYAEHSSNPECASCHVLIDPIGFGLENYDGLGRFRAEEAGEAVDASGYVDFVAFDGAFDLAEVLLEDPRFRSCFVETWRRWGTGEEACATDPGEVGLLEPLAELTERVTFTLRAGARDEGDTFAVGQRLDSDDLPDDPGDPGDPGEDPDPEPDGDLELTLDENSRWETGYCVNALVSNHGDVALAWEVRSTIEGSINNAWETSWYEDGGAIVFSGMSWNETVQPGSSVAFGFCADL